MSSHSLNSPSSLARRLACLGSGEAEKDLPNVDSKFSLEGTQAHELLSKILGKCDQAVRDQYPLDMRNHCDAAAEFVWELMAADPELVLHLDSYVDPARLFGNSETAGSADIILISPTHLYVYDFKYGAGVDVAALHNKQCLAYGAGAVCNLVPEGVMLPTFYHFGIIQPRTPGPMIKQWDMGMQEFKDECTWVATQLKLIGPDSPLNTGSHCQFCKAKPTCSKRQGEAQAAAVTAFAAATGQDVRTLTEIPLTPTETNMTPLSNQALADLIDRSGILMAVIADCRKELQKRILAGQPGCGYKVVRGTANRKWIGTDADLAKKFKNMKLKEEDYYTKKLASPAVVEKCTKLTDKQQSNLKKLWTKPEGALTLKTESASGKAVVLDSTVAFDAATGAEEPDIANAKPLPTAEPLPTAKEDTFSFI